MSLLILPSRALLKPDRPILAPGWDDAPIDRPRGRWWRRLLSGAAGNTRLQPGACCGCAPIVPSHTCGPYTVPDTLTLTDSCGTISFVLDPTQSQPTWFGGHCVSLLSAPVVITPLNVCAVQTPSVGNVLVCYQMTCFASNTLKFSIQRSWSFVFKAGTLTPIYYQAPSGTCPPVPGLPCVTSPPAICGSPLIDTAGLTANPSSTSPFTITGTLTDATANNTVDPCGGGVTISG